MVAAQEAVECLKTAGSLINQTHSNGCATQFPLATLCASLDFTTEALIFARDTKLPSLCDLWLHGNFTTDIPCKKGMGRKRKIEHTLHCSTCTFQQIFLCISVSCRVIGMFFYTYWVFFYNVITFPQCHKTIKIKCHCQRYKFHSYAGIFPTYSKTDTTPLTVINPNGDTIFPWLLSYKHTALSWINCTKPYKQSAQLECMSHKEGK